MKLRIFRPDTIKKQNEAVTWTPLKLEILQENWQTKTADQLAKILGIGRTNVRKKLYEQGRKKQEMEYWTDEQVQFLRDNYKEMGDVELSEIFQSKWPKKKKWCHKHIDKKRRVYLQLHRTQKELAAIKARNIKQGRYSSENSPRWPIDDYPEDLQQTIKTFRKFKKLLKQKKDERQRN